VAIAPAQAQGQANSPMAHLQKSESLGRNSGDNDKNVDELNCATETERVGRTDDGAELRDAIWWEKQRHQPEFLGSSCSVAHSFTAKSIHVGTKISDEFKSHQSSLERTQATLGDLSSEDQEAALTEVVVPSSEPRATIMAVREVLADSEVREPTHSEPLRQSQEATLEQPNGTSVRTPVVGSVHSATSDREKGKGKGSDKKAKRRREEARSAAEEQKVEDAVLAKRDAEGRLPCFWHLASEGCRRGAECNFSHELHLEDAERAAVSRLLARRAADRSPRRKQKGRGRGKQGGIWDYSIQACRSYAAGQCSHGDQCEIAHE